jgi:hypothetical protein
LNIEEFIATLPANVIAGDQITIPDDFIRRMFTLCNLGSSDTFYHLGIGNNISTLRIAVEEFNVKKAIGVDVDSSVMDSNIFVTKTLDNVHLVTEDMLGIPLNDATVVFSWFIDESINELLVKKFQSELKNHAQIISVWSPPSLFLPDKVDFPITICKKPFRLGKSIKDQLRVIYSSDCIDFTASWNLADKYIKAFGNVDKSYYRFLNMLHSLIIWFNAREIGVACEDEVPPPVKSYVEILRYFFNIDMGEFIEHNKEN